MSIPLETEYSSSIVSPWVSYLKNNPKSIKKIDSNRNGDGKIFLNNPSETESFPTQSPQNNFLYSLYTAYTHYEQHSLPSDQTEISFFKTKTNFEYNFLLNKYEDYLSQNPLIQEQNLPNFYYILQEELINSDFKKFKGQSFFDKELSELIPKNFANNDLKKVYFSSNIADTIAQKTNIEKIEKYFKTFSGFKEQFPFYTEVLIDPSPMSDFCKIFDEHNLYKNIFEAFETSKDVVKLNGKDIKTLKLDNYLKNYINSFQTNFTIDILNLLNSINKAAYKNELTMRDVLSNSPCYAEVIGYKVSKYDVFGPNPTPLQTWYFPNVFADALEFIDTQVKYNKEYEYRVSLLYAVIDTEFTIKNFDTTDTSLNYNIKNKLNLYEIHSTSYKNKILDKPPLSPEVEFIPFIGVSNKIKINLNTSIGKIRTNMLTVSDEEKQKRSEIVFAQNSKDGKVIFESTEPTKYFELYRLEKEPVDIEDFFKSQKVIIETSNSSAASYQDSIFKNTKYYYMFRCIDYHNFVSNPSTIYEVEITEDNGLIIPIIKEYRFIKENQTQKTKNFKRYMSIKPALGQIMLNEAELLNLQNDSNQIPIGIEEVPVWDRNFKIRLTSKSTGKKIDLNFTFVLKREEY